MTDTDQARSRPSRRLPRIRLSVRALMLLILAFGCWLGWHVQRVQIQRAAVAAIKRAGGSVAYDWEWGTYNPDIIDDFGKPRAPKWLASRVGVDYVANVVHVSLVPQRARNPKRADDETLAHVGRLSRLEHLSLNGTAVTDAGLAHLKGLISLNDLGLWNTKVGDAGLAHLKGLTNLRSVFLAGTQVTDDGVLALEEALPGVLIYRDEAIAFSPNAGRAINDLPFARSQPIRLACLLLVHRAKSMASRRDLTEFIATIHALCDLEANDQVSLLKLAAARAECLGTLEPSQSPMLSASERQALNRRCSDRGIAALTRAVELGYKDTRRLDGDIQHVGMLWNLRSNPDFPKLVETMKANRASH